MGEEAKCPYCGMTLEDNELLDCYCDGERAINKYTGECPACKKHFVWEELYKFEGVFNVEEEIDNG